MAARKYRNAIGPRLKGGHFISTKSRTDSEVKNKVARKRLHSPEERQRRILIKVEVLSHYGKDGTLCCKWESCNVSDIDMLTIDHVNNDGYKDTRHRNASGYPFYAYLRKENYPLGFQTLCCNHQWKKHMMRVREITYERC